MNPTHVSKCSCSSESFNDKLQSRVWLLIVVFVRCIDCCNLCEIDVFGCIWWQDACACAPTGGTCNRVVMFQLIAWTILMRDNLFQPVWLPECSSDHVSTAVKFCFKHVSSLLHTFASYFSRMCAWMYACHITISSAWEFAKINASPESPNHKFRGWEFFDFCLCGHGSSYTQRPRFELSIQFEDNELTIVVFFGGGYIHFWAKHAKIVCWSLFRCLFMFVYCFYFHHVSFRLQRKTHMLQRECSMVTSGRNPSSFRSNDLNWLVVWTIFYFSIYWE